MDRRQIAETLLKITPAAKMSMVGECVVSAIDHEAIGALRDAAALLGGTCATCLFFQRGVEGSFTSDDRCCHPSEVHPLHWQETRENFSCNEWQALASGSPTGGDQ